MQAIRILLEVEAAAQALPHIGPAEFKQIKAAQEAFENAVARGSEQRGQRAHLIRTLA